MVVVGTERAGEPAARGCADSTAASPPAPYTRVRRRNSGLAQNEDRKPGGVSITGRREIIGAAVVPLPFDERRQVPAAICTLELAKPGDRGASLVGGHQSIDTNGGPEKHDAMMETRRRILGEITTQSLRTFASGRSLSVGLSAWPTASAATIAPK